MKKPSFNKVVATFGIAIIFIIVYAAPAIGFEVLILKNPSLAITLTLVFAYYYFEIRTFANWVGKKYKEIT
jgi:uncharacterized RDD family membrane protein YckC